MTTPSGTSATSSADHFLFDNPATTTTVTSSADPGTFGSPITFTATVTWTGPGTPSGTVIFMDGNTVLGSSALALSGGNDVATLISSVLSRGSHTIKALYYGDDGFLTSMGSLIETIT